MDNGMVKCKNDGGQSDDSGVIGGAVVCQILVFWDISLERWW